MLISRNLLGVLLAMLVWLFCSTTFATDLVRPDPSIAPDEVVAIQLMGLKNNDLGEKDYGIRQTWNFAHPNNRSVTGPFSRFALMLKGPGYSVLLNHKSHEIRIGSPPSQGQTINGEIRKHFDVFMETAKGDVMYLSWIVQKVTNGKYKDCWMTVAVSAPVSAGQSG